MNISGKIGVVIALTLVLTFPVSVESGSKPTIKTRLTAHSLRYEKPVMVSLARTAQQGQATDAEHETDVKRKQ